jgi:gliding motility-associated protein GldM
MAGGNLSPRQKMINLMYLVFIAMLALNMDKKVLSSFGFMKEKMAASNVKVNDANANILENLAGKAEENPTRYGKKLEMARAINASSNEFFNYLNGVKAKLTEKVENPTDYETMDSEEAGDLYFFGKDEKFTPAGQEFVDKINKYRTDVLKITGDSINEDLKDQITKRFSTADEKVKDGEKMIPWLNSRYKGFPLITTLTNIEQIQADIRTTEADVFNSLLGTSLLDDTKMSSYKAIVALDKTAFFAGEKVTGKIVLGKYDSSLNIDNFTLTGASGTKESGQVNLNFTAGSAGTHPIKGSFTFKQRDGQPITLDFASEYTVITEPNQAVISADKMNVVYRGLDNPLSISVPGVGDNALDVRAPGLRKVGNGQYMITPTTGSDVTINVSAKLSSGKTINTSKLFRIKGVPAPMGAIRQQTGNVGMPKESLSGASVGVVLPDFVFDLTFQVIGFSIKVPGEATIVVTGARMNDRAQAAINKAKRGDIVSIFDIKSSIVGQGAGVKIPNASPVLVEIK